jgi:serine/threonine protein kinase
MAEVYKAYDPGLKRWVALKRMRLDRAGSNWLGRHRVEAQALARLAHPHIVKIYGYVGADDEPALVMEYISGGTLEARLQSGLVAPEEAARLVAILAWAVHAAHEKGIVHRDLKPSNVLMDEPVAGNSGNVLDGFPKISDFGLATLTDVAGGNTLSGTLLGTPSYMSPEQAAGKQNAVGPPTDVWAMGVILYRCLTGELPFSGETMLDTLENIKALQLRPPRELFSEVPCELEEVCLACLRRAPQERPTAAALAQKLEQWRDTGKADATTDAIWPPRHGLRKWWVSAAAFLVVTLSALAIGIIAGNRTPQGPSPAAHLDPLRVKLQVLQFEHDKGIDVPHEEMGTNYFEQHFNDRVILRVELSQPAHCFLLACNFDGKEQLLWPCDEQDRHNPGDSLRPPPLLETFQYPPPPRKGPDGKTGRSHAFALDDDKAGGMQAFLVVASRNALPSYREWSHQRGAIPWRRLPATAGVWRSSGETLDPVTLTGGRTRGHVVALEGQPPLLALCNWARGEDVDAVEGLIFPVYPREGK